MFKGPNEVSFKISEIAKSLGFRELTQISSVKNFLNDTTGVEEILEWHKIEVPYWTLTKMVVSRLWEAGLAYTSVNFDFLFLLSCC